MKKYLLYMISAALAVPLFVSCEDNRGDDMVPDKVYLRKYGTHEIATYSLNNGEVRFDLWAYKGGNLGASGDVRFTVDPGLISAYNEGVSEENQLRMLPAECFRMPYKDFHVSEESPAAKFYFYYDPDVIASNYGTGRRFALPFRIRTTGIEVNEEQSYALLIFDVSYMQIGFYEYPMLQREIVKGDAQFNETLTLVLPADTPEDIQVSISTADQSYVDAYNSEYGTKYTLMPAQYYSVVNTQPVIAAGSNSLLFPIRVSVGNLPSGLFMIPVAIESASGVGINPGRKMFYFIYKNSDEWLTTALDKERWSIVNVSSTGVDENSGPHKMIDGLANPSNDERNYWGVNYGSAALWDANGALVPGKDQWVIVDFGETVKVSAVKVTARNSISNFQLHLYLSATAPAASAYTPSWHNEGTAIRGFLYNGDYNITTVDGATAITDDGDAAEAGKWTHVAGPLNGSVIEKSLEGYHEARYMMLVIPVCQKSTALSEIDILRQK